MNKNLAITSFLGFLAVVLGAFATHSLKDTLTIGAYASLQTAIRYQIYHVLVVLFVNLYSGFSSALKNKLSVLFFIGILFFSGSIYTIYLGGVPAKSIWFITPLGGLILCLGWLWMVGVFLKKGLQKGA